jgi:uncharacterized membrane protein YqaE (UPF0057 family)
VAGIGSTTKEVVMLSLLGLVLAVVVYFLPTMVAVRFEHPYWGAIALLNLLLGWTILGWIAALVWAFVQERPQRVAPGFSSTR